MRVLVTGGTGFIGANLVRRLLTDGSDVHLLARPGADRWRLADVANDLHWHAGDLGDEAGLEAILSAVRPTHVVHLATYGAYPHQTDERQILQTNFWGGINLLHAAEAVGFSSFVNTGSSSEYGKKSTPMREDNMLEPAGAYAVGKAAFTLYCRQRAQSHNLPLVTLRPFSVFGPYEEPGRLFPTAVSNVLRGKPVRLAHPAVARDFTAVDDVVSAYLAALERPHLRGEVINLASGRQTTLGDFSQAIAAVSGGRANVVWDPAVGRPQDTTTWVGDPFLAATVLGWRATTDLKRGLSQLFAWLPAHLDRYDPN